ncbi:MAG: nickel-dependent lactate racemase [Candidatus Aenigmatarchaeota archaeon]
MKKIFSLPYGSSKIKFKLYSKDIKIIKPNKIKFTHKKINLEDFLDNPIASPKLSELLNNKDKITIITNDITRPIPKVTIIQELLKYLKNNGISYDNIKILLATGAHRKHTLEEKKFLLGEEILKKVKVIDHDAYNESVLAYIGKTSFGTEIKVNEAILDSFIITTGIIDLHWFAGYTGGAKSILPGISAYSSINKNHSMLTHPFSKAGVIDENPVRKDIDEAGKIAGLNFIINIVLNDKKEIVELFAGDYLKAHRKGTKLIDKIYKVNVEERFDIVIASPGGFPKDINLYQSQKGLEFASYIVKDGGIIILVAECRDEIGNNVFEEWIINSIGPNQIIERFSKEKFVIGGHKAYAFARIAEKSDILLVSSIPRKNIGFIKCFSSIDDALKYAFEKIGKDASIAIMPYASSTLPVTK